MKAQNMLFGLCLQQAPVRRQRGATLAVGLILLVLVTLLALYGASGEVLELRASANESRSREAMAAAEFGAEQGAAYVRANWDSLTPDDWSVCTTGSTAPVPCKAIPNNTADWHYQTFNSTNTSDLIFPTQGSYILHLLATSSADQAYKQVFVLVVEGFSRDGDGKVILRQALNSYPLMGIGIASPLTVSGAVSLGGNFNIYGNPNGGGPGVPLSVWSSHNVGAAGSPNTYYPNGDPLSSSGNENIDILDVDGNLGKNPDSTYFPPDLFEYVFGVPTANYKSIKSQAQVISNCSGVGPTSKGLIWVTGNCTLAPGDVGTPVAPVLLVVEGEFKLNANGTAYGLMFSFCDGPDSGASCGITQANGDRVVRGSIMADEPASLTTGGLDVIFDPAVLKNIGKVGSGRGIAKIPASWINW